MEFGVIMMLAFLGFALERSLNKIINQMLAARLRQDTWPNETDGVRYRTRSDGVIEALTYGGYQTFATEEKFTAFMAKRPDFRAVKSRFP